jgi:hypothetical protein
MGTLTKDPGDAYCPEPAGYQAVLYNKDPQGNLYGYAFGTVDANGKFAINVYDDLRLDPKPLAPCFIGVIAKNGYGAQEIQISLNEQGCMTQDLVLKKSQGAADPNGGTASVTVLRSDNDEPITNASVVIEGTGLYASTNENGIYTIKNIPAGTYSITATAYPFIPNSTQLTISEGKTSSITIKLTPLPAGKGTFYGYVSDNLNNYLSGAKVEAGAFSTQTNASGFYTLEVPGGAAYNLKASLTNYKEAAANNQIINEGAAQPVNFVLEKFPAPAPTVSGITPASGEVGKTIPITDLAGDNFVSGATVKLTKTGQADLPAAEVNVVSASKITCSFDLSGATEGKWKVTVTNPDGQSASLPDGFEITTPPVPVKGLEITTASPLTSGTVATDYSTQLSAANGTEPYTWSLSSGALPPGLDLNDSGVISGTPTTAGQNYSFTVKVADKANASTTKEFKLTINDKTVPEGTVKLNIKRSGGAVEVAWDTTVETEMPKIYILINKSALSGTFANAYSEENWKTVAELAAAGENIVIFGPEGKIVHVDQDGKGYSEVYYKAVKPAVDLTTADGKTTFASAWAVGKINVDLYGGWNLVSAPFVADSLNNVLGTDYKDNEQLWIWSDADSKFKSTATFSSKSWPADLNISPAQGYWLDLSGTAAGQKKTITLTGTVYTSTTINKKIYAGWDLIGNPYPKPNAASEFTPAANDQIWVWDNEGQKFTGTKNYDGANWSPDALLIPGKGYWYNHIGKGFEWKATN